jgi:membrane protein
MPAAISKAWGRFPAFVRTPLSLMTETFRLYFEDNCSTYAAAIAYYALFSLVPLSLIILSFLGLVVDRQRIVNFVFDQIPLQETESVRQNVNELVQRARDISFAGISFGLLALLWSGSGIFGAVRRGLNATSHRKKGRPYWHGKLIDFALIPGLGVLVLLSISLTAAAQVTIDHTGHIGPLHLDTNLALRVSSYALPAVVSFAMFNLLYRYVPSVRPPWPETLSGAAFATVTFELVKTVGAILVSAAPFSKDTAIYAGFSTAFVFLFWMFINASILLLGSEFARALARRTTEELETAEQRPARAAPRARPHPGTGR